MTALEDVRVVECGTRITAPFCSRLFADLGACVTKVEPPEGDPSRAYGPFPGAVPDSEECGLFHYLNAGKRSLAADLDVPAELELFHSLLAGADVLVENTTPAERSRWALDFGPLLERHPHLVAVSLSPFGRTGPWSDRPGSDLTAQAASSLPLGLGDPAGEPLRIPYDQAEYQAAFHGFAGALCALRERESSGRGQAIDIATAQVMAYCVGGMHLLAAKSGGRWERRGAVLKGALFPTGLFECADGFVCIVSQHPKQWELFLSLMGDPEWAEEENARNPVLVGRGDGDLPAKHFRSWLCQLTRTEVVEIALSRKMVLGPVQTIEEVLESAQLAARDLWAEIQLGGSSVRIPKPGYLLSRSPVRIPRRGPALDSDGESIRSVAPEPIRLREGRRRQRALEGIRVLDFGWNWAGPMAGQLFADMGAEVIRIETRKRQDLMRFLGYASHFFAHNNRSKLSATINIAKPEGARLLRKLAGVSDIVMDNFAAGVMARNVLSYEDLRTANPDIIAVSMSMAGQHGPLRGMRGFASIATGYSALEMMVGYPETGTSTGLLPFGLGDTTMAIQGVAGALAALHHRNRTGEGQFVDVSQIDSAVATMGEPLLEFQLGERVSAPLGNAHSHFFPHGIFSAAGEDRWIALCVRNSSEWRALCRVIGRSQWATEENFADAERRRERAPEIIAAVEEWCAGQDRDDAAERLCAASVPAAPVLELDERDAHPHFEARELSAPHVCESFDPCRIYATPWGMSATPPAMTRPAPALGEHNLYVFRELLGLEDAEIERLQKNGILE